MQLKNLGIHILGFHRGASGESGTVFFPSHQPRAHSFRADNESQPLTTSQFSSVTQSCPSLYDLIDCSMPGFPVHHHFPESAQTHVHWVSDAIQPSRPLSRPFPPACNFQTKFMGEDSCRSGQRGRAACGAEGGKLLFLSVLSKLWGKILVFFCFTTHIASPLVTKCVKFWYQTILLLRKLESLQFDLIWFWHYLPGASTDSRRLRAPSYKTAHPETFQMPTASPDCNLYL